eukprot:scaffold9455_cov130-Isochrysis_galbana.AAC.4
MGRLTTIKPGAAAVEGLTTVERGAIGVAMAGTPPDRGTGARVTIALAGPTAPKAHGGARATPVAAAKKGRLTTTIRHDARVPRGDNRIKPLPSVDCGIVPQPVGDGIEPQWVG